MKIVVTGAGGLIGQSLVERLAPAHEVWAVSREPVTEQPAGVRSIVADLSESQLPAGLPAAADAVVHLAQSSRYRDFPAQALDIFNVNLASTARLLDWSRGAGVRHFTLASTGGVVIQPHSYYTVTKQSAEDFAGCYVNEFGVLVLRFHFVYGRRQRRSMLVPRLIDTIQAGQPVTLAGADGPRLNPIYVDDAVRAIEMALQRQVTGTIAIAGAETLTIRAMAEVVAARAGRPATFTADPSQQPQDVIGDISEMTKQMAAPEWAFGDGISEMLR